MVKITSELLSCKKKNIRFFLNYPRIEFYENEEFAKYVNQLILNNLEIFQEIVECSFEHADDCSLVNAISEFQVAFNKNNIVSIPMEFSQIIGFTDISHIYSYNYDFEKMEIITLDNIFREGCNYEKILESYILEQVYEILEKYSILNSYDLIEKSLYICDKPVFYFNERELVICIASFEFSTRVCNLIEFPIEFVKIKGVLSEYTINKIFN